ncbi:ferric reductase NAD binding domain-containing protein [Elsinoe ampelina]|uniref:Ferric reductase NAD binding domain-containing protein n=1 Tax=Elsinoe ampelina TaxID=302913 RepID=A0A6A6G1A8_9PEZI|nr:ferric reductase NAD binding domain-containing protein [Elsinoe ampelina]
MSKTLSLTLTRLRSVAAGGPIAFKPTSVFDRVFVRTRQIFRSIGYAQATPNSRVFSMPPLGTTLLITCYVAFLLALEFYPTSTGLESSGYRAGWLAIAQLPLLIALINKNNVITLMTRISYERLNTLHHWVARALLLLALIHFAYLYVAFSPDGSIFDLEWTGRQCVPTGLAALCLLIWINLSTLAPIRRLCYEFFVIQHIICWLVLIGLLITHVPSSEEPRLKIYLYIPLTLYLIDRLWRVIVLLHRRSVGTPIATLQPFPDDSSSSEGFTKITIPKPNFIWQPGSHVLLSFPSFAPGESHPATIVSTPTSHNGAIICLLKAETGFTRILSRYTTRTASDTTRSTAQAKVLIDGPYASHCPSPAAFESVLFIAAGSGVTYTLSHLQALAERMAAGTCVLPVRKVRFVWVVRRLCIVRTLLGEVAGAIKRLDAKGVEVSVQIYVTGREESAQQEEGGDAGSRGTDGSTGEDERGIVKAFTPVMATREASVVADSQDLEKGEWRLYAVRMQSVVGQEGPRLAEVRRGRPGVGESVREVVDGAEGEVGVITCGPGGFVRDVRNGVAGLGWKGEVGAGVWLWVEGQGA